MTNIFKFKKVALIFLLLAVVLIIDQYALPSTRVLSSIYKLFFIVLIGAISYWLLIDHRKGINVNFMTVVTIGFPIAVFGIVILFLVNPVEADRLSLEDGWVENVSALFLIVGSLFMTIISGVFLYRKEYATAAYAFIFAVTFFVIGMEEISWMQRLVERESSDVFMKYNIQGETNIHNIMTRLFEKLYYAGGFILLTLIPMWRGDISRLMKNSSFKKVVPLLPGAWLVIPFLTINGFSRWADFLLINLFVIAFIIGLSIISKNNKSVLISLGIAISLLTTFSAFITISFLDYGLIGTRHWFYSEFREMLIAFGIMVYSMDRLWSISNAKEALEIKA